MAEYLLNLITMNLLLNRFYDNGKATLGVLYIDGKFECFTLEDEGREKKIAGETRIPAGNYQLKINKTDTPLTLKYRKKYPWFKYHIEVTNVPNFQGVYIHIGNYETDTAGCILVGDTANKEGTIQNSTQAFIPFYTKIYQLLDKGEKIMLEIKDGIS